MAESNYFVRLVNRTPRFGRVLFALVAVVGLFVAVWSGQASAAPKAQGLVLQFDEPGSEQISRRVKVCGPDQENIPVCTEWTTVQTSAGLVDVFPGWLWQGQVTVCVDTWSHRVEVNPREYDTHVSLVLSGLARDQRDPECQPVTDGQQIEVELKELDGSTAFDVANAAVRVCGTNQHGDPNSCSDLKHVRGPVFATPDRWYIGPVNVTVTSDGGAVMRQFCVPKVSEDRWAKLKWWAPSNCQGMAAAAAR